MPNNNPEEVVFGEDQDEQSDEIEVDKGPEAGVQKTRSRISALYKKYPRISTMIAAAGLMGTCNVANEACEAYEIGNLKDDIVAFDKDMQSELAAAKEDPRKLTELLKAKYGEINALINRLEELQKDGVELRTDIVVEALTGVKKGKNKAGNPKVGVGKTINEMLDGLGDTVSKGSKKAVAFLSGIDLSAFPELSREVDELTGSLKRLRTILIKMENRDLTGPTNNYVANAYWSMQNHDESEAEAVEHITERKELRDKEMTRFVKGFGAAFEGGSAERDEILALHMVLEQHGIITKDEVSDQFDPDIKKAGLILYGNLLDMFMALDELDPSKPGEYDSGQLLIVQKRLKSMGYMEEEECDGIYGERTHQALLKMREDFLLKGFEEEPKIMVILTMVMAESSH